MSDPMEKSEKLAVLVADGKAINWVEALSSASDESERRIIRHLRLVESVAHVHRTGGSQQPSLQDSPTLPAALGASKRVDPEPQDGVWGHLEIREKLGEGGFGAVYRAWDRRLDRDVALKLHREKAAPGDTNVSRFIEEGRLLAKLRHPNVVSVHGAEVHEGRTGLWMEFIKGRSLEQLLDEQGPFGAREAALIGIDLCRALAAVHQAGVIHRDVKAQNAMREEGGRILLTDFGAGIELSAGRVEKSETELKLSGTPYYMAPELFRGEPASQRSDLYSLGVLLYHIVTRSFPVQAASWPELRDKHARRESKLLRDQRPDLPEGFVSVIERSTAWDPAQRYATAGQMEQGLAAALGSTARTPDQREHAPLPRRAFSWRAAALITAVAAIAGLLVLPPLFKRPSNPASDVTRVMTPPAGVVAQAGGATYTVEAAVYRLPAKSDTSERLESGARLQLGDRLTLEFMASTPLHVYVINEDEAGHSYALFPLPGIEPVNPLAAGTRQVLPGTRDGKRLSWTVDSPGGREHLMVLASPTRLVEFEAEMNSLARAGQMAVSIPDSAKVHLRGIGGLTEEETPAGGHSAGRLFEMAKRLAARSEVAQGVWMRRIDLENPPPD